MLYFLMQCKKIRDEFVKDEITVYAAQASFFIVLSFFPFTMILITVIQMIPAITRADLLLVICRLFPERVAPLVESVINNLYTSAPGAILSVTTIATIWSASRGMRGIERGLNRITDSSSRRGYVLSRIFSAGYTVIFLAVCIASLGLMVFGSVLQKLLLHYLPILHEISPYLISLRTLIALAILIVFFMVLYTYLPYRRQVLKKQWPGAIFSTVGWLLSSYGFSIYFNHFTRFSYMYGSLAGLMILMLWLYFGICIMFLGAEVNQHMRFKRKL